MLRVEIRTETLRSEKKVAEQAFRELDIFRKRFYEPSSCVSRKALNR